MNMSYLIEWTGLHFFELVSLAVHTGLVYIILRNHFTAHNCLQKNPFFEGWLGSAICAARWFVVVYCVTYGMAQCHWILFSDTYETPVWVDRLWSLMEIFTAYLFILIMRIFEVIAFRATHLNRDYYNQESEHRCVFKREITVTQCMRPFPPKKH